MLAYVRSAPNILFEVCAVSYRDLITNGMKRGRFRGILAARGRRSSRAAVRKFGRPATPAGLRPAAPLPRLGGLALSCHSQAASISFGVLSNASPTRARPSRRQQDIRRSDATAAGLRRGTRATTRQDGRAPDRKTSGLVRDLAAAVGRRSAEDSTVEHRGL